MPEVQIRTVDRDEAGIRLDRWFKAHFPGLGFGHLQKLLRSGQVRVDGKRVETSTRLAAGQQVRVPPLAIGDAGPPRPAGAQKPDERLAAAILHEDDQVIVFNKPAGLAVQGGSGVTRHVDAMLEAFTDRHGRRPKLVHRLDRDTSGVLVVARTRTAAAFLGKAFKERATRKVYWALVAGVPRPAEGRISTFLRKEEGPGGDRMRIAKHGERGTDHAVSEYAVADQAGQKLAWLVMRPITGRTHQLRAHAAHIGHPIVGDPKYFNIENWQLPGGIQNRLHLHARRIVMPHPAGGMLDVTAPLPPHMRQSWSVLGFEEASGEEAEGRL
ncbi:RluA family pseudouridine synthase [Propylenella binzhouense]|uniref:Pseudouridine synthase n=1 Tax=Propylenella binzhouense TaxID=2555902 RepID=A0A964T693_9HYPH|nr:RluA family pseudouridine synthase [Propylenella binzhouense]